MATPAPATAPNGPDVQDVADLFNIDANPAKDPGGFVTALVRALMDFIGSLQGRAPAPAAPSDPSALSLDSDGKLMALAESIGATRRFDGLEAKTLSDMLGNIDDFVERQSVLLRCPRDFRSVVRAMTLANRVPISALRLASSVLAEGTAPRRSVVSSALSQLTAEERTKLSMRSPVNEQRARRYLDAKSEFAAKKR